MGILINKLLGVFKSSKSNSINHNQQQQSLVDTSNGKTVYKGGNMTLNAANSNSIHNPQPTTYIESQTEQFDFLQLPQYQPAISHPRKNSFKGSGGNRRPSSDSMTTVSTVTSRRRSIELVAQELEIENIKNSLPEGFRVDDN